MRHDEIQAVLNGLRYEEEIETEGARFLMTAVADYTPGRRSVFSLLTGEQPEPAERGELRAIVSVSARSDDGNVYGISPTEAPTLVLRRFADLKDRLMAWQKNEAPWPRVEVRA